MTDVRLLAWKQPSFSLRTRRRRPSWSLPFFDKWSDFADKRTFKSRQRLRACDTPTATCNAMLSSALRDKLQEMLHRVTCPLDAHTREGLLSQTYAHTHERPIHPRMTTRASSPPTMVCSPVPLRRYTHENQIHVWKRDTHENHIHAWKRDTHENHINAWKRDTHENHIHAWKRDTHENHIHAWKRDTHENHIHAWKRDTHENHTHAWKRDTRMKTG